MAPILKILVPVGAGLAALFALTSKSSASPASSTTALPPAGSNAGGVPPEIVAKIATALATADPVQMRKVADEVERAGFPAQAKSLRDAANAIQTAIAQAPGAAPVPGSRPAPPAPAPVAAPPIIIPTTGTPLTSAGIPQVTPGPSLLTPSAPSPSPERDLAASMVRNLQTTATGQENKSLVSAFQIQEQNRGFYQGNIDSKYGPKSAMALALDFKIVPPKPRYWTKGAGAAQKAKKDYAAAMATFAAQDPPRREEWLQAGRV